MDLETKVSLDLCHLELIIGLGFLFWRKGQDKEEGSDLRINFNEFMAVAILGLSLGFNFCYYVIIFI